MSTLEIIILAFALSIDASIVAFSNGLLCRKHKYINSILLAFFLGFFQFIMPLFGYYSLFGFNLSLEKYANVLVFLIFTILGAKFIFEALKNEDIAPINCILSFKYILIISVTTSIDALFAGVSLSLLKNEIFIPAILIGIVTFFNALLSFWFAKLLKFKVKNMTCLAGFLLIILGIKSLLG